MSEFSYQDNLKRGVTGSMTGTCLPAAYDRISPRLGVAPGTYQFYESARRLYVEACGDDPEFVPQEILAMGGRAKALFRRDLGVESNKNIVGYRANTEAELRMTLSRLAIGGFRTSIYLDVGGLHAVGVEPVEGDHYDVKSTWSPFDDELVSVSELYTLLERAPRGRKRQGSHSTYKRYNIVALPPEPKR